MFSYTDLHGNGVELSFKKNAFALTPSHVLVLAKMNGKWLLTKHRVRGLEFPGGKQEENETLEQAAEREVMEETGATIEDIRWFATYVVQQKPAFGKAVFLANVTKVEEREWMETEGAVFLTDDELMSCEMLSFHMKDVGMQKILEKVREREDQWSY
ncbi:NUDIX domain-containing protein [Kurthia senegalensis]|uniref:NUDIX domain-containing protein n=1 Tax=Kurthia senegalensis TaxID=1033740 RepID=UPI0002896B1A|nr:NUDIX domain-containing protein [Kurthia senegalensis]